MIQSNIQAALTALCEAEDASRWRLKPTDEVDGLLGQTSRLFLKHGEQLALETAERMGVTPAEVWLEVIFPSVWGILSTRRALQRRLSSDVSLERFLGRSAIPSLQTFAGQPSIKVLPANWLEALLLPGFAGHVLLKESLTPLLKGDSALVRESAGDVSKAGLSTNRDGLALCLLPFNLASIGVLDIVHLICHRGQRVVAKISEKVEFIGPYLEKIFAPFIESKVLAIVHGGPDTGAWLAARPEFFHIHLTGSARTAANVEEIAGPEKVSSELGGVTPAILLPDALSNPERVRQVARQVAFGALANNGQHCVSFQLVFIPQSRQVVFEEALWKEMQVASRRGGVHESGRKLVDSAAAFRLESLLATVRAAGAETIPSNPKARQERFPVCLVRMSHGKTSLFREEAFGPVVGIFALPDNDFRRRALTVANSEEISGDLGASIFTATPQSPEVQQMAVQLRHGMVMINTYPGVAFATSVPWGAGLQGRSGRGWVHNYRFLPEAAMRKVILSAPLGRKGFGPLRWEDPWLLNVSGEGSLKFAQALVRATIAFFDQRTLAFLSAQLSLMSALAWREWKARRQDKAKG